MDVNVKDDNGWNVLHEAATYKGRKQEEIFRWLLEETSIDINASLMKIVFKLSLR